MANKIEEGFKELKIEGKEEKTLNAQYMGTNSLPRFRYHRSQSNHRSQSRGRSRDSQGGRGDQRQDEKEDWRSQSRVISREGGCIGCKYKDCVNMRKASKAYAVKVNEVEIEMMSA